MPPVPKENTAKVAQDELSVRNALTHAARYFDDAQLDGSVAPGWRWKSGGSRIRDHSGSAWLHVRRRDVSASPSNLWTGEIDAESLVGVPRPRLRATHTWTDGELEWMASVSELVDAQVCSVTPELSSPIDVGPEWLADLRTAYDRIRTAPTSRINTRQDLVSRRLAERFGSEVDPVVRTWETAHGDLHWANLTHPKLWILDWESWGRAPLGLDPALLRAFSLLVPPMATTIEAQFTDVLSTPDGVRTQLFVCAELLRMIEVYGDHPKLKAPLEALANALLRGEGI